MMESGPFRFARIEAFRVRIKMLEPFRISSGEVSDKDAIVVRVSDGDAFGWGESSAMPGGFYSAETPDSCERDLVEDVLPSLVGRAFASVQELEAELTGSRFVRAAVETAAWELCARKQGVSLRSMFGIADRPVPSGLAVGLYSYVRDLKEALFRYGARDYQRLKIKIKRGQDVELVASVREWLGDFPLFVDANADYTADEIGVFRELDRFRLMMYEQPLGKDDFEGLAALQRAVATPVCCDESIECADDARRAIEMGACRIVNIKLQRVGGYLEAFRILDECQRHGIPLWMGTMPELGIGSAQALVMAAHPAFAYPTDVEPSGRWYTDDILAPRLVLREGHLHLPSGPGIGFEVDPEKLERYTVRRWEWTA